MLLARAAVILIGVAALVSLSISFDARLAIDAQRLSPDARVWGQFLSWLGQYDHVILIAGALVLGALIGRAVARAVPVQVALTLLAERAAYVAASISAGGLAAQVIKHVVGRARPASFDSFGPYHFDLLSMKYSLASFPSGHTTNVFATATALALLVPSLRVPLFTLAAAIASSRIVVQAHYLSDIAAGCVLGVTSAILMARTFAQHGVAFTAGPDGGFRRKGAMPGEAARRG